MGSVDAIAISPITTPLRPVTLLTPGCDARLSRRQVPRRRSLRRARALGGSLCAPSGAGAAEQGGGALQQVPHTSHAGMNREGREGGALCALQPEKNSKRDHHLDHHIYPSNSTLNFTPSAQVCSYDHFNRHTCEGYGWLALGDESSVGSAVHYVHTWKPQGESSVGSAVHYVHTWKPQGESSVGSAVHYVHTWKPQGELACTQRSMWQALREHTPLPPPPPHTSTRRLPGSLHTRARLPLLCRHGLYALPLHPLGMVQEFFIGGPPPLPDMVRGFFIECPPTPPPLPQLPHPSVILPQARPVTRSRSSSSGAPRRWTIWPT